MLQKVQVTFTEIRDNRDRQGSISEILAEGAYVYLKTSGLLREDIDLTDRIRKVLEKAKKTDSQSSVKID